MQLLQARKMRVNSSSRNQNHYKYVQLDVLFNPNKYVLQDFARSFVRTSESESWEFFQQTENFIPLQRYLTNLDLQTIGSLHVYASCKFFAYWPSIYTFINEYVILFFQCFCQSNQHHFYQQSCLDRISSNSLITCIYIYCQYSWHQLLTYKYRSSDLMCVT